MHHLLHKTVAERSEGSLRPFHPALAVMGKRWWSEERDASLTLSMTNAHGVEYGDRTVSMSEASRRAVEKLAT